MGVAVAVDDGLLVPVVRDVDQLSISGLNRAIAEVAGARPGRQAQARRLRREHVHHRQHRLVRLEPDDADHQRPRGRHPDHGGDHQASRSCVETPDGDVIAIRPIMNMVLAIDHRANDGAQAAAFLRDDQDLARGDRAGDAGLLTGHARSSTVSRRVFVTGAAGFIGGASRASCASAATRSSPSSAIPARAAGPARRSARRLVAGDLGSEAAHPRGDVRRDAVIHLAGSYRVGIPASERPAMYEANVALTERVLDAAIAARRPADRLRLDRQRLRQHPRPDRRRDVPARPRRRASSATTTRRSTWPTWRPRRGSRPGAPIVIVMPGDGLRRRRPLGDRRAAQGRLRRHGALHRPRRAPGSRRRTSTTSRRASSRRSTAAGSGEAYVLAGENMRLGEAMRIAARAGGRRPPRLAIPNGRAAPRLRGSRPTAGALARPAAEPARDRQRRGRRDLLGQQRQGAAPSSGTGPRDLERGARDAFGRDPDRGPRRTLRPWPASSRCSAHRTPATPAPRRAAVDRARWRAWRACRPPTARPRSAATPTGSAPGCRRARTTTSSRACSAACRSTRSARRPTARTSGSAGTSAPPRS